MATRRRRTTGRRTTGIKNQVSSTNVAVRRGASREARVGRDGKAKVACPGCGNAYLVPEAALDRELACKGCGKHFVPRNASAMKGPEPFNAKPYYIGGGILVAIIGVYLVTRSGPAQAAPPAKKETRKVAVTGIDNPRVRAGRDWGQAIHDDNSFQLASLSDPQPWRAKLGLDPNVDNSGEAIATAILADPTHSIFKEFDITSAALHAPNMHDQPSGKVDVFLYPKAEWKGKAAYRKNGKPHGWRDETMTVTFAFRMDGDKPRIGTWEITKPCKMLKKPVLIHKTHDIIGEAKTVKRNFGGQMVDAVEAELKPLPHLEDTSEADRKKIDALIEDIISSDPRKPGRAILNIEEYGRAAMPRLLNKMYETKMDSDESVKQLRRLCQAAERISGQRFGFTSAIETPSGQSLDETRVSALRQWYGYWATHYDRKNWDIAKDREESLELDPPKNDDPKKD